MVRLVEETMGLADYYRVCNAVLEREAEAAKRDAAADMLAALEQLLAAFNPVNATQHNAFILAQAAVNRARGRG
jgi:hypothetical protein